MDWIKSSKMCAVTRDLGFDIFSATFMDHNLIEAKRLAQLGVALSHAVHGHP